MNHCKGSAPTAVFYNEDAYLHFYAKAGKIIADAEARSGGQRLTDLTDEERWAALVLAGRIQSITLEDDQMVFTTEPCAVTFDGRDWHVYRMAQK
jgi:hypothetical protein